MPTEMYCSRFKPTCKQWEKIEAKQHHGIAVALFSLKTKNSSGIGEFYDLLPLIDWCKTVGFDIVQLLPINDSGPDPSPYSTQTAMGLHPIYLSLHALDHLDASDRSAIEKLQTYNSSDRVLYNKILTEKLLFLQAYYKKHFPKIESEILYQSFIKDEAHWLNPYARYKVLKEKNKHKAWWHFTELETTDSEETFYKTCQFLLFSQMIHVKREAEKKGIFIKGDIPILLNKDSSDVWQNQHLFCLETSVGAPPDIYNHNGQNWGFPAYNWQALKDEGYSWWLQRLKLSEKLYHLCRLDHIVGFYRIWAIRDGMQFFEPAGKEQWLCQGETILTMITSNTSMLPIGDDLGLVPDEIRENLQKLGIAKTKVMRWERNWNGDQKYINPNCYPLCSMTTVSTHDSEPLGLWWKTHGDEAVRFCFEFKLTYNSKLDFETRKTLLQMSHHTASLFHINLLTEYLALFPELSYQDDKKERINVPGTVSDTNWTLRLQPSVETIVSHEGLQKALRELL